MNKILSLIIPTYNMEKYLDRCLASLICDAVILSKLEVLVINDGSTDGSSEIAHQYADKYPETFVVVDKQNGHYGSCVNKGIELAKGKYVKVVDADDWINTTNLEGYLAYLESSDADMFLTDTMTLNEYTNVKWVRSFVLKQNIIYEVSALLDCIADDLAHQVITYKTSILRGMNYRQSEGTPYTDLEWDIRPLAYVKTVMYYPHQLYCYLRGRENQSVSPAIHCRDMANENRIVLGNAEYYEKVKNGLPESNQSVMRKLESANATRIYFHYLINFPKLLSNSDLAGFDNELKSISPEVYASVSGAKEVRKFMTFDYVSEWRKNKSRSTIRFRIFDLGISFGQVMRKMRH